MAGRGSRFADAGYTVPKPLIPIHGVPMIDLVIDNLRPACVHRFVFLCLREHMNQYGIDEHLRSLEPNAVIIPIESVTEGAACTVLLARDAIDSGDPLMIANSDQWVDLDIDQYLDAMRIDDYDGFIMTMRADDPKWSYVRLDEGGRVIEVVEKQVVSNEATVGIYNYARGTDFVGSATVMIEKDLRVNGEFYVAPVYNEMIAGASRVGYHNVGQVADGMYGLGVPADLSLFESLEVSRRAASRQGR
jgi:dTDP-glucose pyrophosphorylase